MTDTTKDKEFEDAFNEGTATPAEVSDDEAFGITPPEDAAVSKTGPTAELDIAGAENNEAAAADAKAVADEANAKASTDAKSDTTGSKEAEGSAAEEAGETPLQEAVEAASGAGDLDDASDVPAEDMQKFKSWQGRLKKIEADLKAKADSAQADGKAPAAGGEAAAASDAIEEVADQVEASGDGKGADTIEQVAEQVKSGELSPKEAMERLAEDFGEEFVSMIEVVARSAVEDKVGALGKNVEDVISHIQDSAARAHFETIYDANPDFMEVSASQEFKDFVAAQGAESVVDGGTAKELNKLLGDFKAQAKAEPAATEPIAAVEPELAESVASDAPAEDELDAAEGVRSSGLRLPTEPKAGKDDFEGAWNEFA